MGEKQESPAVFDRFQLWKEYEEVAMHFNDLIIRLRTQSLGAVAAFATVAGVVAKNDMEPKLRWGLLTGAFSLLAVFWVAVWILDFGYYNRLLNGAVDALRDIEAGSHGAKFVNNIDLSTKIHAGITTGGIGPNTYRTAFYIVVLIALLAAVAAAGTLFYVAAHNPAKVG